MNNKIFIEKIINTRPSSTANFRDVTGGVYKDRITYSPRHSNARLLAIPALCF